MSDIAIRTYRLTKQYGSRRGLDRLDLEVRTGEVYGFLGPNGAGKTTTIRLLLDLLRPTSGTVRVLGMDPRADGVDLRRRVGYLAGDFVVNRQQTVRELLTFLARLRGGVPASRVDCMTERLGLDPASTIKQLSKGNRQKVGVVQAFMHDPELLILDEPTTGLDPLLQREFLSMVGEARAAGRTVFMSSHVMSEVQQTADRVGIIRDGRMVSVDDVDELRRRAVRRVEIEFEEPVKAEEFADVHGLTDLEVVGSVLRCRLAGPADALVKAASRHRVLGLLSEEPDLEELLFTFYDRKEAHVA